MIRLTQSQEAVKGTSGIYTIYNTVSEKGYIGSSNNVERRLRIHQRELRHNRHDNAHLQKSFNKHGINAFVFELVEACPVNLLQEAETRSIQRARQLWGQDVYNILDYAGPIRRGADNPNYRRQLSKDERRERIEHRIKRSFTADELTIWNELGDTLINRGGNTVIKQIKAELRRRNPTPPKPRQLTEDDIARKIRKNFIEEQRRFYHSLAPKKLRGQSFLWVNDDGREYEGWSIKQAAIDLGISRRRIQHLNSPKSSTHQVDGWRVVRYSKLDNKSTGPLSDPRTHKRVTRTQDISDLLTVFI